MEGDVAYILLSAQRGLTTHVAPQLRAVTVDFDKAQSILILHFFYDGEVTDELFDLASCATAEMDPGVFPYTLNDEFTTQLNYPAPLPIKGRLVYLRYEPIKTVYHQKSAAEYASESYIPIANVQLSMIDALLGRVTPELRIVTVDIDTITKQLYFYFYYDGEISQLNFELARLAVKEASSFFPGYKANEKITRVDLPKRVHVLGTACVYERAETYDLID